MRFGILGVKGMKRESQIRIKLHGRERTVSIILGIVMTIMLMGLALTSMEAMAAGTNRRNASSGIGSEGVRSGDRITFIVIFKVRNGAWNDGTTADKIVILSRQANEDLLLLLSADSIPAVGSRPAVGYEAGGWDVIPNAETVISNNKIYTYTYVGNGVPPTPAPTPTPAPQPVPESDILTNLIMNSGFFVHWKGRSVVASWGEVPGADSYDVWATYCGTSTFEKIKTVKSASKAVIKKLKGKKLDQKRGVKVFIVAKQGGAELGRTHYGHCASSRSSRTNAKRITIKQSSYTLTAGQTAKIKAKIVKEKSGRKLLHGDILRYASSHPSIATVNTKGIIHAVGTGTCKIWVYALNGYSNMVTVTVQ